MGFAFQYVAGFYLTIGLDLAHSIKLGMNAGLSTFQFSLNNGKGRLELEFNLVALALIYWIDKLMKRVRAEAVEREVSSIGVG